MRAGEVSSSHNGRCVCMSGFPRDLAVLEPWQLSLHRSHARRQRAARQDRAGCLNGFQRARVLARTRPSPVVAGNTDRLAVDWRSCLPKKDRLRNKTASWFCRVLG